MLRASQDNKKAETNLVEKLQKLCDQLTLIIGIIGIEENDSSKILSKKDIEKIKQILESIGKLNGELDSMFDRSIEDLSSLGMMKEDKNIFADYVKDIGSDIQEEVKNSGVWSVRQKRGEKKQEASYLERDDFKNVIIKSAPFTSKNGQENRNTPNDKIIEYFLKKTEQSKDPEIIYLRNVIQLRQQTVTVMDAVKTTIPTRIKGVLDNDYQAISVLLHGNLKGSLNVLLNIIKENPNSLLSIQTFQKASSISGSLRPREMKAVDRALESAINHKEDVAKLYELKIKILEALASSAAKDDNRDTEKIQENTAKRKAALDDLLNKTNILIFYKTKKSATSTSIMSVAEFQVKTLKDDGENPEERPATLKEIDKLLRQLHELDAPKKPYSFSHLFHMARNSLNEEQLLTTIQRKIEEALTSNDNIISEKRKAGITTLKNQVSQRLLNNPKSEKSFEQKKKFSLDR